MLTSQHSENHLPIMEYFYTIQGEGFHSGRPAFFIRLSGCDVGCVWCDVKESWDINDQQYMSIDVLLQEIQKTKADFIVITGGEPLMHNLSTLSKKLKELNKTIAIETSGTYPSKGIIDWFCFSPKKFRKPLEEAYAMANELKIIINHKSDFDWALEHAKKVNDKCHLFLQPEWSKEHKHLPEIIDFIKEHPEWRISLQTHKYINIP